MKIQQVLFNGVNDSNTLTATEGFEEKKAQLVLAFAERSILEESFYYKSLKNIYPNAAIVICSTSGQISNDTLVEKK